MAKHSKTEQAGGGARARAEQAVRVSGYLLNHSSLAGTKHAEGAAAKAMRDAIKR